MRSLIAWYKKLRKEGNNIFLSIGYGFYNFRHYNLDGTYLEKYRKNHEQHRRELLNKVKIHKTNRKNSQ